MAFAKIKPVPEEYAMNAVLYCRFSSDKQKENSIDFQLHVTREYCERKGFNVVGEYIDRAVSGTSDQRPEFQRMIRDAKKQLFAYIVVYRFDRFARNRYDSAIYKKDLQSVGVRVLSAEESVVAGDEGIILESIYEAMAESYSRKLSRIVKESLKETARKGLTTNIAPYGYKSVDHRLVTDEKAAEAVRLCYKMYSEGRTKKQITDALNDAGFRTSKNGLFKIENISRILKKRCYIGENNYGDVERECPRIVDDKTFYKVQDLLEKNKKAYGKKADKAFFALSGKMFCGECGTAMVGDEGTSKGGKKFYYYTCAKRKKNRCCVKKSEKKDFIEWYVCEQTVNYLLTDERIKDISEKVVALEEKESGAQTLKKLEKQVSDIDKEFSALTDKLIVTDSPTIIKTINKRAAVLEQRKAALEKDITDLKIRAELKLNANEIESYLNTFRNGDLLDEEFRRHLIHTLINAVYIWDDKVCIYYNVRCAESVSYIDALSAADQLSECSDSVSDRSPWKEPDLSTGQIGFLSV
ncbi:MAG: recombinase family protein, partial [Oscillospiraceae bacterium]|nr:recombinase family protein [Oscillospiraceae bacterium]